MTDQIIPQFVEKPANKKSIDARGLVYGVGINDANYVVEYKVGLRYIKCPQHSSWVGMLTRCHSRTYRTRQPTYLDVTVCDEWLIFSVYKMWMDKQDWRGKELDKDLLVPGNRIYSPETCIFVSSHINSLLLPGRNSIGKYPQGVTLYKRDNTFEATCSRSGQSKFLGRFKTPEEAELVYKKAKAKEIRRVADLPENEYIREALYRWANTFRRLVIRRGLKKGL